MTDEDSPEKAAGDVVSEKGEPLAPPPPPPPDVELIVDGFGFMPKTIQTYTKRSSKTFDKSKKMTEETNLMPEAEEKSPCGSSSNIDIVRRYTWKTKNRMIVQVITYGATITSIQVPDRKGVPDDVVAGFDTLEEYLQPSNPYFGATIGRYANIIRDGTFMVRPSGRMYMVSTNRGHHHYHGGYIGFDKVNWRSYVTGEKVIMSHVSERFHEGYPGTVMAQVMFEVSCDNTIKIEMRCTTSEPTIVNLSSSPYFNLAGHHAGCESMFDHIITINGDKYTPTDEEGLVTGEKKIVGGTAYDFRVPRVVRTLLPRIPLGGYDVNFCVTQATEQDLTFHARAMHPGTGRVLEIYSNQPGLQFYTGNLLPDPDKIVEVNVSKQTGSGSNDIYVPALWYYPLFQFLEGTTEPCRPGTDTLDEKLPVGEEEGEEEGESETESEESSEKGGEEEEKNQGKQCYGYVPLVGKQGTYYKKHGLFCLTPQNYPDAVNHKNFPNSVLNPGEVYVHRMQYKFGILLGKYV